MQLAQRLRLPAIFCAFAVLLCELIAHPFANMGVIDDAAYIPMVQHLAATGHIAYTGWAAPMLTWQLYLAAALIKLFGFSFTTVRTSTLLIAMALAFLIQRLLVRFNLTERNATIGTLALVLSPLYLMLSVTFMSDIFGLFAIAICLYACLRAIQSTTDRAAIAWLCLAVATNAFFGTARQVAWLGVLIMLPSTLWLLRSRRTVLIAGAVATLAGTLAVFACMHWFSHQPYSVPQRLVLKAISPRLFLKELAYFSFDTPFLLLPTVALFLPQIRKLRPSILFPLSFVLLAYVVLGVYPSHLRGHFPLDPIGECINTTAGFAYPMMHGTPPDFLPRTLQAILNLLAFGAILGLIATVLHRFPYPLHETPPTSNPSWPQLRILLLPFALVYTFLICTSGVGFQIHDRYLLGLLLIATPCLFRYYQERASPALPLATVILIAFLAIYSSLSVHQMFAAYRARVQLASELTAAGIPLTSVDNGWEFNFGVELQHADHINTALIEQPLHAYVPPPPLPPGSCSVNLWKYLPHIRPQYSVSFDPDACYGPAPIAPVHYSRWPYKTPGTLYVVQTLPPDNHLPKP